MKKRLLTASVIGIFMTFSFAAGVFAASKGINVLINGQKAGLSAFVKDGRVMVPLEEVTHILGGTFDWSPENETATVNLPQYSNVTENARKNGHTIKNIKVTEGISTLTLSGEVTNTSSSKASFTVYGQLLDNDGQILTRTTISSVNPAELSPGETGSFEIIFTDYDRFKDKNARYGIYVQGFSF